MHHAIDELFSPGQRSREPADLAAWGTDWTTSYRPDPAMVVFPKTIDEVVELVRLANRDGLKLVPSGGRTGLSGGAVAGTGEIVVSFDKMNQVVGFNAADRLVTCQLKTAQC